MDKHHLDLVIRLRRELHAHPELSYQEVWTKKHLMTFLQTHTKNIKIIDKGKYFYAIYKVGDDKSNVAFRADFDALPIPETIDLPWKSQFPGISHKCGHDGHSAILAGLALEVDRYGADQNIIFIFQHAEETAQGAIEASDIIQEESIDEIYGFHNMSGLPFKTVNVIEGTVHFASKGMSIEMVGSPAHASQPEDGINPSHSIAKMIEAIPLLTSSEEYKGAVSCTIVQIDAGSKNFGIAAHKGVLRLTVRAEKEEELIRLQKKLENVALALGNEHHLQVSFQYTDEFPVTVNTKKCVDKVRDVCREKGISLREMSVPYRASEDFGYYVKEIEGAFIHIGNGEHYPPVHTYAYDFRDDLIETVVEVCKGLAGT